MKDVTKIYLHQKYIYLKFILKYDTDIYYLYLDGEELGVFEYPDEANIFLNGWMKAMEVNSRGMG